MTRPARALALAASAALALSGACKREERGFRVQPPSAQRAEGKSLSNLYPGEVTPPAPVVNELEQNAFAVSEGKSLYEKYNCVGCHAYGGGAIGPALMDDKWIYGASPENVYATIVEGRPNGMPSWRGKIPENQVWEIVAYVRSMSGLVPGDVAPTRGEHMMPHKPESQKEAERPGTAAPSQTSAGSPPASGGKQP